MTSQPALDVLPRDLSACQAGNTGVPYVHRFDSGRHGPHVLVNALTHGNEFCGMVAACHLLDTGVRPLLGTLTISFANVAAYQSFDATRPFDSRQLVHNLNRIWSDAWLDGPERSPELDRARQLRPVVTAADHILDIHSTSQPVQPFWVYPDQPRHAAAALAIGEPAVHLVMPQGLGSGTPLIQHGRHGTAGFHGVGLVAECGQHFQQASADRAIRVAQRFLAHVGLVDPQDWPATAPAQRYQLLQTVVIQTPAFRFTRPLIGFETFGPGELIATDGPHSIHAPADGCTDEGSASACQSVLQPNAALRHVALELVERQGRRAVALALGPAEGDLGLGEHEFHRSVRDGHLGAIARTKLHVPHDASGLRHDGLLMVDEGPSSTAARRSGRGAHAAVVSAIAYAPRQWLADATPRPGRRACAGPPQPTRNRNRCSLPLSVRGRLSRNSTARGYL